MHSAPDSQSEFDTHDVQRTPVPPVPASVATGGAAASLGGVTTVASISGAEPDELDPEG